MEPHVGRIGSLKNRKRIRAPVPVAQRLVSPQLQGPKFLDAIYQTVQETIAVERFGV